MIPDFFLTQKGKHQMFEQAWGISEKKLDKFQNLY
jgi:hypothetical protein